MGNVVTLKSTNARIDALDVKLDAILALLAPTAPAKAPRAPKAAKSSVVTAPVAEPIVLAETVRCATCASGETTRATCPQFAADEAELVALAPKAARETPEWIIERAKRSDANVALAAWLREKKLPASGAVWAAAKAGTRNVAALRKLV